MKHILLKFQIGYIQVAILTLRIKQYYFVIQELEQSNIKCILNCAYECKNLFPDDFEYLKLTLSDQCDSDILIHFEQAFEFISKAKEEKKNVLVHCQLGKSRSATIVIGYLMKYENYTYEKAFTFVKKARKMILPNLGFVRQLRTFENS